MKLLLSWLGYIGVMFAVAFNATSFVFKSIEHGRVIDNRGALEFAIFYDALIFGTVMVLFIISVIRIHAYANEPKRKK